MNCKIYTNCDSLDILAEAKTQAFHNRLRQLYPCVEDVTKLPQSWSSEYKGSPLGLTGDKLGCYFRCTGHRDDEDRYAAAIRTDQPILPACFIYYFEITFVSKGSGGVMGVGLSSSQPQLSKLPGWARESYGYHADDGKKYNGDGKGQDFGPKFTTDDVIGCGYNLVERNCFFTKNGIKIGLAFEDMPNISLYPTIGLKTHGEEIYANFGQEPFKYNIEQDLRTVRKDMIKTFNREPEVDFGGWQTTLNKLVQSWLVENSYPGTAQAFAKVAKLDCKIDTENIQERNEIQQLVLNGNIEEAIKLTDKLCPNLFQENPGLLFALRCRQFVELIGNSKVDSGDDEKLADYIKFGRELNDYLAKLDKLNNHRMDSVEKMFTDAISLLAFDNPKTSSYAKNILDPRKREPISQLLNSSIINSTRDKPYKPPLEQVINHIKRIVRLNDSHGRWLVDNLYHTISPNLTTTSIRGNDRLLNDERID